MAAIQIQTTRPVIPQIYAYTTPEIHRHDGWTKIGYTEQDVATRINQQTHTADILWKLEWHDNAVYQGTVERFTDKEFHAYLRKQGVEQEKGKNNEWFHISPDDSELKFNKFRKTRGTDLEDVVVPYVLRHEQESAVDKTTAYAATHANGEFLWNAKPRFGKTLSTYDLMKKLDAKTVLIVTNRPAIANSWYDDYKHFVGQENGYLFVSEVDALKDRAGVLSRSKLMEVMDEDTRYIEFVSLQDMKGSIYFGGHYDKLKELSQQYGMEWDLLVIDEAHEGVYTYKTDVAFDQIKRKFTLHLSGTPFKVLAMNKFAEDAIYNWTYADEQKSKRDWEGDDDNPYGTLPKLNLFTYQMSEIVRDDIKQGVEINGETVEYAFDLNEFFRVQGNGQFVYNASVDRFLDALVTQEKFPFSTEELRGKLKHTFWLLNRVDSAKALVRKLQNHPVFKDYEIVLVAGDGKVDDADENKKSFDKVREAIKSHDKTITLSVGQLTTGVTIPEWTAVLMLSNVKSPALYMQAAFRAQNPCLFATATGFERKENAYVFDFDPARTLIIYEAFANDLSADTALGRGSTVDRKENIRTLLNFFPVIGEDKEGHMVELDAEQVLTIPHKIKSVEVVRRGFMSDFLFANISHVFAAPKEVQDIINQLEAVEEPKGKVYIAPEVAKGLSLNEDGEVELTEEHVIGQAADLFGDKVYGKEVDAVIDEVVNEPQNASSSDRVKNTLISDVIKPIVNMATEEYELKPGEAKRLESQLTVDSIWQIDKAFGQHEINTNVIEKERDEALQNRSKTGELKKDINARFDKKLEDNKKAFAEELHSKVDKIINTTKEEAIRTADTSQKQKVKETIENGIRDHLRGFSRTIPSFLMAYGDNTVTLSTFDGIVPGNVFKEVTSITLDQFRMLRDGGEFKDSVTGEMKHFDGHLFDEVVFDDSVKEFLALKKKLADYFDEKAIEDIFDYIPPQKTNQIFTPKMVVKKMVDMLEQENPGCFDLPDKTFIDLYMKSGLYITEIVKRLYRSPKMQELYPDKEERLRHIFEKQVYGLAPTEIIYKIAISYILGFDDEVIIPKHNFRQADALPYAKEGKLQELLDGLYDS